MAYSTHDQQAVAFAFLAYLGQDAEHLREQETAQHVYDRITQHVADVPVLTREAAADWDIVWGPAFQFDLLRQQNMMMVVRQKSQPTNLMVVVRGTNFVSIANWIEDDFEVGETKDWVGPDGTTDPAAYGAVSKGTHNDVTALLAMKPVHTEDPIIPGAGQDLQSFLTGVCTEPVNLTFTGHSLGGCISPVAALHFAQSQGGRGTWDPNGTAAIQVTAFAGPTPGNAAFASYLNSVIPESAFKRYNDSNDIAPLAWNAATYATIPTLYKAPVEPLDDVEKIAYDDFQKKIADLDYAQPGSSVAFTFPVDTDAAGGRSYAKQIAYQHHASYPTELGVPAVLNLKK